MSDSFSVVPEATPPPTVGVGKSHERKATLMSAARGLLLSSPRERKPSLLAIASIAIGTSNRKVTGSDRKALHESESSLFPSSGSLDAPCMELFFHVPTHRELQRLRVPRTLTLIGLQALVQRECAIPFEDQRLYWHGDLLEGDEELAFYGLHDQSVLNLRVRKRYRPIGDVFTKIKTVQWRSVDPLTKSDDCVVVEIVAPLPPTRVVLKRLVAVITYLHRLDSRQAQRTQRRVWNQRVAFWEEPVVPIPSTATGSQRRRSLASPLANHTAPTHGSSTQIVPGNSDPTAIEERPLLPPAFVKLHTGPERVSYVVSLAQTHLISQRLAHPSDQRSPTDLRHIKKWLASTKFFASASLPDAAMHEIALACTYVRFNAGDFLFRQGDIGDHFYILISGCVSLAAYGNGFFATMTPGQCFGEISLSAGNSGLRTASANVNFAAPIAELALLSGEIYRRVINPSKKAVLQTTEKAIYSVPQLRTLPDHVITHVAYASKKLDAKHGRLLVRRGEDMHVLVLLIKGEVKVSATIKPSSSQHSRAFPVVSVVRAPAVFCQEAVLTNMPASAPWDIEALDACTILCFRLDTISVFLAPHQEIIRALNHEHTQRLQEFERRFAQYAPAAEKRVAEGSAVAITRKASSIQTLSSRLFGSPSSTLDAEQQLHVRRGAATHVQFPSILLRGDDQRNEEVGRRDLTTARRKTHDHSRQSDSKPSQRRTSSRAARALPPSCAALHDEFLHRSLPFGEILDLRDQIRFCSFAANELETQDHGGRTRALLRGLRQQPVEEVEMISSSDTDTIHFQFVPRPPTSSVSPASLSSPLVAFQAQRRNLQTR